MLNSTVALLVGSTTSQLSYLGPSTSSFNPLGFPNPYLLAKDGGAGLAAAAAAAAAHAAHQHHHAAAAASHFGHGGGGPKRIKEPKPGSDVRSFGCQVFTLQYLK